MLILQCKDVPVHIIRAYGRVAKSQHPPFPQHYMQVGGHLSAPAALFTALIEYDAGKTPDKVCTLQGRDISLAYAKN